jgi:hypothetical protein
MSNIDRQKILAEQIRKEVEEFVKNGGKIEKLPAFGNPISHKKTVSQYTKTKDKLKREKEHDKSY